jgi:hypothetical protein
VRADSDPPRGFSPTRDDHGDEDQEADDAAIAAAANQVQPLNHFGCTWFAAAAIAASSASWSSSPWSSRVGENQTSRAPTRDDHGDEDQEADDAAIAAAANQVQPLNHLQNRDSRVVGFLVFIAVVVAGRREPDIKGCHVGQA